MDDGRKKTGRPRIYGEDDNYERELAHRRQIKIQKQVQEEKEKQEKQLEEEQPAQQDSLRSRIERKADGIRRSAHIVTGSARKREQENARKMQVLMIAMGVLIVLLVAAIIYEVVLGHGTKQTGAERMAQQKEIQRQEMNSKDGSGTNGKGSMTSDGTDQSTVGGPTDENKDADKVKEGDTETSEGTTSAPSGDLLEAAKLKAMQYDYDGALALLKSSPDYEENEEYQAEAADIEKQKNACVPYRAVDVTHIFFHTLIHDAKKAFDGDEREGGYNQFMVTETEFISIIQQMYDRGYVMVFIDELVPGTEDGNGGKTFTAKDIMLPPDKTPFVLSQDDVSYYHYMSGDGFASRLIVDENGDVKNEYIEEDGSVSVGDYDMVPLIDRFVEEHPDFSYHGQKGYVALTGYEGILGYRTDEVYKTKEAGRVTAFQQAFFDSYPGGFDEAAFEKECEGAKKVAEAMKNNGWKFASHTWGHQNMHETNGISMDAFKRDTDRWETWVEPLIGETDTLIYAFGGDIRGAESYSGDRFSYLKQCGFDYFCGVDSAKHWMQIGTDYVRQSRRNIDGYRMYYNPEMLSDLFDVATAWDPLRPASVPPI